MLLAETAVLANQLREAGFKFVSLSPGWVETDMGKSGDAAMGLGKQFGSSVPVEKSVAGMLEVLRTATVKDSGKFKNISGADVPF